MRLPVVDALPALREALATDGRAVLVAPPGSGKTTVVPPWLMDSGLCPTGEIVVLQPRRVAARSVARYLAESRGESVGQTVGYQVRFEKKVSSKTRIRIVTEGILTAWLQRDPFLEGVAAVVVDEFHERSVHADLGLALLREVTEVWRDDLKIIVMSATLAAEPVSKFLGDARIVRAEGRAWPIAVTWLEHGAGGLPSTRVAVDRMVDRAVEAVVEAVKDPDAGDVLVFMPGAREIDDTVHALEKRLATSGYSAVPLHGRLPADAQDKAVRPDPNGRPRVVVATNVAETSLTIPGIRTVIDSGLARVSRFDPAVASTRLELERISKASAEQRAGRAGRLGPGRAIRLWTRFEDERLEAFDTPEIHRIDPSRIVLELRQWGVPDPAGFAFFEAPNLKSLAEAEARLAAIGAVGAAGLTPLGRAMTRLPLEPRAAAALLLARRLPELPRLATILAAQSEGAVADDATTVDANRLPPRIQQAARQLRDAVSDAVKDPGDDLPQSRTLADALVTAYLDRVAVRRPDDTYQLSGGRRARATTREAAIVALELDGGRRGEGAISIVRSFVPVGIADLVASPHFRELHTVAWDERESRAIGVKRQVLGDLVIDERPAPLTDRVKAAELLVAWADRNLERVVEKVGPAQASLMTRLGHLARLYPALELPSDPATWVQTCLPELCRELSSADTLVDKLEQRFGPALESVLSYEVKQKLRHALPEHVEIPSGRSVRLEWVADGPPILAAKVQELFGWDSGPMLADGRLAVVFHLLDPGGKPLQVTRDLASFWRDTWKAVRAEMRSRYPKHHWPEDPRGEVASIRTTARAFRAHDGGS